MKKMMYTVLGMMLCIGMLAGCGNTLESESSLLYVDKKGGITFLDVGELDADIYDAKELDADVDAAVEAYNEENGKNAVRKESFDVDGQRARLTLKYKTPEDYTRLNGIELYCGKIVDALAAGYIFDGEFVKVEDGAVAGPATKQEIYAEPDLKTLVIRANTDVRVSGEICYVSCENVKLTGKDSISIRDGYDLESGSESVQPDGTEQQEETAESGLLESDVYTFIVYK